MTREKQEPQPNITQSYEQMLEWCEVQNARGCFRELAVWYFVETTNLPSGSRMEIKKIEGVDADNIRSLARGPIPDLGCFDDLGNQKYRSRLRAHLRRGMTAERYSSIAQDHLL